MAYYTGTAANFTALRAALIDACGYHGWSWDAGKEELSKGGAAIIHLTLDSVRLGARARVTSGSDAGASGLCYLGRHGTTANTDLVWPVTYRMMVFTSPDEVFLVVNHSVDIHQFMAFGKSAFTLPGSGVWLGASLTELSPLQPDYRFVVNVEGGSNITGSSGVHCPVLFAKVSLSDVRNDNSYLNHALENGLGAWQLGAGTGSDTLTEAGWCSMLSKQPNAWNSEAVLLPLRAWLSRSSYKLSCVADLANARLLRIDYYEPGQVLTIGTDRWMVFPWYRKDLTARDGGGYISHTGTLGWAIRYDGP